MPEAIPAKIDVTHFWLRRLHSLLGLLPVSLFLVEHTIANSFILKGPEAYDATIHFLRSLPYVIFLEVVFIGLPILYHALYGVYITFTGSVNVQNYTYLRNWMYFFQRVSGLVALVFIAYHVWQFRIASDIYGFEVSYEAVAKALHVPWIFWFYVVGMAGTMFHFGNGLWLFCITWGITVGPKSQRVAGWLFALAGLALFWIGIQALWVVAQ